MTEALEHIAAGCAVDAYDIGTTVLYTPRPRPFNPVPLGPPRPPFNPILDGGLIVDIGKSTPNTTVIKERIGGYGGLTNAYIHHDKGPGRINRDY